MSVFDKVGDFLDQIQTTEQYTKETLKNDGGKKSKKQKNKDPRTPKGPEFKEPPIETPQGERARIRKKLNDSFIGMSNEFDASMKEMKRKKGKGGR